MKVDSERGTSRRLQDTTCTDWINRDFPERCARVRRATSGSSSRRTCRRRPMHFCIDRFEYPNRKGEYPIIVVTWHEAGALCEARGKRLCTEDEWTFACEGEEAMPYPTATSATRRRASSTGRGSLRRAPPRRARQRDAIGEIDYALAGRALAARSPRCRSPFGVYDMTGNVDEWTRSSQREGYASILKGGYWGPVRTRCRPATRAHDEDFFFYQQGFRCCADAPAVRRPRRRRPDYSRRRRSRGEPRAHLARHVEQAALEDEVALRLAAATRGPSRARSPAARPRGGPRCASRAATAPSSEGRSRRPRAIDARLAPFAQCDVRRVTAASPRATATRASRSASRFAMSARLS